MEWRRPPAGLTGHVILCNASSQVRGIVAELHSPQVLRRPDVLLLVQDRELWEDHPEWHPDAENPFTQEHFFVLSLVGGAASTANLRAAGLDTARVAVILADPRQESLADARSTLVALSIERCNPAVHTIMELINSVNRVHLETTDVNEVVCIGDLAEKLIAQSTITPGIKNVFHSLLSTSEDTCKIFTVPLPKALMGETYRAVARRAIASSAPFVVCGFLTPLPHVTPEPGICDGASPSPMHRKMGASLKRMVLNPRAGLQPGKDTPLGENDMLVVMAYDTPLPEHFESQAEA